MPEPESTVRLATPADLPSLHTVLAHCLSTEPGMLGFTNPQDAQSWLRSRDYLGLWGHRLQQMPEQMAILVATTPEKRVVGFTDGSLCTARLKSVPKWHNCMLDQMVVHPAYQGRGYGSALLKGFTDRARTIGCSGMMLIVYATQQAAITLYERYGYEVRRTCTDDENGQPYYHMSRPLDLPRSHAAGTGQHASV